MWIEPFNKQKVLLYETAAEPTVYPDYIPQPITGYNTNAWFYNETIPSEDGGTKNVSLDLTGINVAQIRLGDGGNVWCSQHPSGNVTSTLPWPRTNSSFLYSRLGDPYTCSSHNGTDPCTAFDSPCSCLEPSYLTSGCCPSSCVHRPPIASDGQAPYPFRLINPNDDDQNSQYWNDLRLWNSGAWEGNPLIQHDGPSYAEGGEEYLMTLGHPITVCPCGQDYYFSFFDPSTNQYVVRAFQCPTVAWNLCDPSTQGCLNCEPYSVFNDDNHRLWVMKKGQDPIPNSIKRYKILHNRVRENFPVFYHLSNGWITKTITKKFPNNIIKAVPDRSKPWSYGISESWFSAFDTKAFVFDGEGDDAGWAFTFTPDGETILVERHVQLGGTISGTLSQNLSYLRDFNNCPDDDDIFIKDTTTNKLKLNTSCYPYIYNPTSFPEYSEENDQLVCNGEVRGINKFDSPFSGYKSMFQALNKPDFVYYNFPEFIVQEDTPNLPEISETTQEKFPLKTSPYLSRESKNTFFRNSNLILFEEKRMLQASELNEFQEKFYRKQKLFIEYLNHWLSKKYLTTQNTNLLGTKNNRIFNSYNSNKLIPINSSLIRKELVSSNIHKIILNPGWYMMYSDYRPCSTLDPNNPALNNCNATNFENTDFLYIREQISYNFQTDLNKVNIAHVAIDNGNIISCEEYGELKDNTGGSNFSSPCGAKRNNLILYDFKNDSLDIDYMFQLTEAIYPFKTSSSAAYPPRYLVAYLEPQSSVFRLANDIAF